ncbi:MAG: hypothetical protein JWP91_1337 [Fibrobacteres bacterium]|nr:hypothetical protein [Fibrobacterota bacterium]
MMWQRLDSPGHEWARLTGPDTAPVLRGTAVFLEGAIPVRLDYKILCNSRWETQSAVVLGWMGDRKIKLYIGKTSDTGWHMDGRSAPLVQGCIDLDLAFSPATNLLSIRRLGLEIGQEAEARSAWLTFPELELRPLGQRIRRLSGHRYAYEADIGFSTELVVDDDGFVVDYPPLWKEEKGNP